MPPRRLAPAALVLGLLGAAPTTLAAAPSQAEPIVTRGAPKSVFILPITLVDLDEEPELSELVASWVAEVLLERPELSTVATQKDIESMVSAEAARRIVNCEDDEECVARIQKQTSADLLV